MLLLLVSCLIDQVLSESIMEHLIDDVLCHSHNENVLLLAENFKMMKAWLFAKITCKTTLQYLDTSFIEINSIFIDVLQGN